MDGGLPPMPSMPRLDMASVAALPICMLYLACHHIFTCRALTSFTWLPFSPSPLFLTTRPICIRVLVVNLPPLFPSRPFPASYLPLRRLPCRPFSYSSILLRLIAAQNGFVLIQQHLHDSFPRSIPLLLWNPNCFHCLVPRFLIHGLSSQQ